MVIMALWYNGKLHYPVKVEMVGSIPPRVASFEAKSLFGVTVAHPLMAREERFNSVMKLDRTIRTLKVASMWTIPATII